MPGEVAGAVDLGGGFWCLRCWNGPPAYWKKWISRAEAREAVCRGCERRLVPEGGEGEGDTS